MPGHTAAEDQPATVITNRLPYKGSLAPKLDWGVHAHARSSACLCTYLFACSHPFVTVHACALVHIGYAPVRIAVAM